MLKEHDKLLRQVVILLDLSIIAIAFFGGYYLRKNSAFLYSLEIIQKMYPLETYLSLLPLILAVWAGGLFSVGAYASFRGRSLSNVLMDIAKAAGLAAIAFASLAYFFKFHYLSRIFIMLTFFLGWMLLSLERIALITTLRILRKKGYNTRYVLLVGTGPRAQNFIKLVKKHPEWGLELVGLVDEAPDMMGKEILGYRVVGHLDDLPNLFEQRIVDEVIFVVPRSWLGRIENIILYCEQLGKRVSVAVDLFSLKFAKATQSGIHDFPLLVFQTTPDKLGQLFIKRTLDIFISGIALILLWPLFIALIFVIKATSNGPIFFQQKRCSLNGRVFTLYKFRTMVANAEHLLESLREFNEMKGPAFKMTNDPRTTPFGKGIRRLSLDELPQLVNVFKGDMSIVGPRPPIPSEVEKYEPWQKRRLSMRPGLTCLWQIKGRNKIVDFNEWMKLDLQYIDEWSLWLDLKIFLKTIPVVLFGIGAK